MSRPTIFTFIRFLAVVGILELVYEPFWKVCVAGALMIVISSISYYFGALEVYNYKNGDN